MVFVPVGGGPTIGGAAAAEVVRALEPRLVVPMHYRTRAVDFLEPPDDFLAALGASVREIPSNEAVAEELVGDRSAPTVARLAPPRGP